MQEVEQRLESQARAFVDSDASMIIHLEHVNVLLDIHIADTNSQPLIRLRPESMRFLTGFHDFDDEMRQWHGQEGTKRRETYGEVLRAFWEETDQYCLADESAMCSSSGEVRYSSRMRK